MMPITIVIDEWADLALQDKNIQKDLCSVAQKGRAAGISIVLATQRPSADIISGLIKANFSGRIALRVSSKMESRIILDQSGAEGIIGVGTGLYMDQYGIDPILFKSPYIENPLDLANKLFKNQRKSFWQRLL